MLGCLTDHDIAKLAYIASQVPDARVAKNMFDRMRHIESAAQTDKLIDDLLTLAKQDYQAPSMPLDANGKAKVNQIAWQMLKDQHERAVDGRRDTAVYLASMASDFGGVGGQDATLAARALTNISSFFLDQNAKFKLWATTLFPQGNIPLRDHHIAAAMDRVNPKVAGVDRALSPLFRGLFDKARKYGNNTLVSPQEMMVAAGEYVNALHALEANPALRQSWEDALTIEQAKKKPNHSRVATLQHRIERYDTLEGVNRNGNFIKENEGWFAGGFTNEEARASMKALQEKYGLTDEQFKDMARDYVKIGQELHGQLAKHGMVSPELVGKYRPDEWYVPFFSRSENYGGVANDLKHFSPSRIFEMHGMNRRADSAFYTILAQGRRVAEDIGFRDLGLALYAAARHSMKMGKDAGLIIGDTAVYNAWRRSKNLKAQALADAMDEQFGGGGIEVDIPELTPEGVKTKRWRVGFRSSYVDPKNGFSGRDLNAAILATNKAAESAGGDFIRQATSLYGQTVTRFQPAFAVKNMIADGFERLMHIATLDHYDASGMRLSGARLASSYITNGARALKAVAQVKRGTLDMNSKMGQYWREFEEMGLHQMFTKGLVENTTSDMQLMTQMRRYLPDGATGQPVLPNSPIDNFFRDHPHLRKYKDQAKALKQGVLHQLDDVWNDTWNNSAPFAHYITLRDAGMSPRMAADAARESLNLYKKGKQTPFLQLFFPFVKPTFQTAANMGRMLGITIRGDGRFHMSKRGIASLLGATAAASALVEIQDAMFGQDPETGKSNLSARSASELGMSFFLPSDDPLSPTKIPVGFGLNNIANTFAWNLKKFREGQISGEKLAFDSLFSFAKNALPANWPEFSFKDNPFEFISTVLDPTVFRGFSDAGAKLDHFGNPVDYAQVNGLDPKAVQGSMRVPVFYHEAAKWFQRTFGLDATPDAWNAMANAIFIGPMKFIKGTMERTMATAPAADGQHHTMRDIFRELGASQFLTKAGNTNKSWYVMAKDALYRDARELGVKLTGEALEGEGEERLANLKEKLVGLGMDPTRADDIVTIRRAEQDLRKLSKEYNKQIRPLYNSATTSEELDPIHIQLMEDRQKIYMDAINNLKSYGQKK